MEKRKSLNSNKFKKSPYILEAIFEKDNEAVLMNMRDCRPYLLRNRTVLRIWQLLKNPIGIDSLVSKIHNEFNSDRQRIERDTKKLINLSVKRNIVIRL